MHTPELEDGSRDCRVSYDLLGGTGCILNELKRGCAADKRRSLFRQLYIQKYLEYCIYFFNLGRREGTGWVELSARASSCWVLWQLRNFGEEEKRGLHPTLCRCRLSIPSIAAVSKGHQKFTVLKSRCRKSLCTTVN